MEDKESINEMLIGMVGPFYDFANDLNNGNIPEFSTTFDGYKDDVSVLEFCHSIFELYKNHVKGIGNSTLKNVNYLIHCLFEKKTGLDINFNLFDDVCLVCDTIEEALKNLHNGLPSKAMDNMKDGFLKNNSHLLNIFPQIYLTRVRGLFRVHPNIQTTEKGKLFHIPFDLKRLCKSYRYSILGYPSLYLAESLETSIKECRIEDGATYSCSAFKSKGESLAFLDLASIKREPMIWEQYSLVVTYPLIIACGLKVKEKNASAEFKEEYMFPQALLEFIRLYTNFDGISYTSTRYESPDLTDWKQRNYVIPVPKSDKTKGYSDELTNRLIMTVPISFSDISDLKNKEKQILDSKFEDIDLD